jgi:hypothetical protein
MVFGQNLITCSYENGHQVLADIYLPTGLRPKYGYRAVALTGVHIEYFGFTIVNTYWADPMDAGTH